MNDANSDHNSQRKKGDSKACLIAKTYNKAQQLLLSLQSKTRKSSHWLTPPRPAPLPKEPPPPVPMPFSPKPTKKPSSRSDTGNDSKPQQLGELQSKEYEAALREYENALQDYRKKVEALKLSHDETSASIRILLRYLVGGFLFCVITTSGVNDTNLLTDEGKIPLPVINYDVNFAAFLVFAPLFMIGTTAYIHILLEENIRSSLPVFEKKPYIFNLNGTAARIVTWLLFYCLTPITLAYCSWKASPIPVVGTTLAFATLTTTFVLLWTQMRRCPLSWRQWSSPLHAIALGIIVMIGGMSGGEPPLRRSISVINEDEALAGKELQHIDLRDSVLINTNISSIDLIGRDLARADLRNSKIIGSDLTGTNLSGANLTGADLSGSTIAWTALKDIVLSDSTTLDEKSLLLHKILNSGYRQFDRPDLENSWLQEADLFGANLRGAQLAKADLRGANLSKSDLTDADLSLAALYGADLTEAKGLKDDQLQRACFDETTKLETAQDSDERYPHSLHASKAPAECREIWTPLNRALTPPTDLMILPPEMGPIVGHTTANTAKVWIKAKTPTDAYGSSSVAVGLAVIVAKDGQELLEPKGMYFPISREHDLSGVVELGRAPSVDGFSSEVGQLEPNAEYKVRLGYLSFDSQEISELGDENGDIYRRLPVLSALYKEAKDLSNKKARATVRTFPAVGEQSESGEELQDATASLSFVVGSDRYPGLSGGAVESDRIIGHVLEQFGEHSAERPMFILLAGNQIYADTANRLVPFAKAESYEEFRERYHKAFNTKNMQELLSSAPTYMILSDHEIEDGWTQDRIRRGSKHQLFTAAIDSYLSYQWTHGPQSFGRRLYYEFDAGGYPFFVLDTRTQRYLEDFPGELSDNHLLGRPTLPGSGVSQFDRLLNWLTIQNESRGDVPKFVVSSSSFVPNPIPLRDEHGSLDAFHLEKSDGWPGFPKTRARLLSHIVENDIRNVVFLGGGQMFSSVAEMYFTGSDLEKDSRSRDLRSFSVTCSPLHRPPFFGHDASDIFVMDSTNASTLDGFEVGGDVIMDYNVIQVFDGNNFCKISVDKKSLTLRVQIYDEDGIEVTDSSFQLDKFGVN